MRRFKILISVLIFLIAGELFSQQLPAFRNREFNTFVLNPSAISSNVIPDIFLNHRSQWLGYEGAPRMSTLAGRYMFRPEMGLGLFLMSDSHGISQKTDINLGYSYLIKTDDFNISFGLSWSVSQYRLAGTRIRIYDLNDNIINTTIDDKSWKPDANAGILFSGKDFYVGFSVLQMFQTKYKFFGTDGEIPGIIKDTRHYFITGLYQLELGDEQNLLHPFTNLYFAKGTPFKFDLGISYLYNNKFQAALMFNKGDAISFTFGYIYERYSISYSFDILVSRIRNAGSGAHEICLGVYLFDKKTSKTDSAPMF